MATFAQLTGTETNPHFKNIFAVMAKHETAESSKPDGLVKDGLETIVLDSAEVENIKNEMYAVEHDNRASAGNVQTATEMKSAMVSHTQSAIEKNIQMIKEHPDLVKDGYYNPVSGIGTYIDPGIQEQTFTPVSMTPDEATGYYASGGIPARIIDKKAGCLLLNGIDFHCDGLTDDDLSALKAYSEKIGFPEAFRDGVTQTLTYGGAVVYPSLAGDNPARTQLSIQDVIAGMPEKSFIKYFVTADRWNVVFVPSYNISAQDYLYAKSIFVPIGGVRVNTERCAMIRPRRMSFWGAIRQMGWSTSDFEGWIKDYESYEIMKASLPIMAQQMSLMYHSFPADGLIMENGPDYAKQFFKQNEAEMREWSMLHPKAINSVGEIKILERTYTGFHDLIAEARLALCASSSVPENIIFADKATGLASDNQEDVTLKQSEAIRLLFNSVAPSFQPVIALMVMSCFGRNSEQAKHAFEVTIAPDNATVLTDEQKATIGTQFTTQVGQLAAVGMPIDLAVQVASSACPSVDVSPDVLDRIKSIPAGDEGTGTVDSNLWSMLNAGRGNMSDFPQNIFGGNK